MHRLLTWDQVNDLLLDGPILVQVGPIFVQVSPQVASDVMVG